jgi:hypothetical protein
MERQGSRIAAGLAVMVIALLFVPSGNPMFIYIFFLLIFETIIFSWEILQLQHCEQFPAPHVPFAALTFSKG